MTRNAFLDKKLIGTLFEDEEITKKDNIFNQEARNDKGQKRFHGAFEGGFEAGYKNTVGSKEGWAPQKFVSSRNNRAKYDTQTISQYMDEEDRGKQKLGVNVTIQADFDTYGVNEVSYLQRQLGSGWLFGSAPEEMIYRDNRSVGYKILSAFKQQAAAKRLASNEMPKSDSEDEEVVYDLKALSLNNTQFTGIGYKSTNVRNVDANPNSLESVFWNSIKSLQLSVSDIDEDKRKRENRVRMDGTNEDAQEEYDKFLMDDAEDARDNPRKQVKMEEVSMFVKDVMPLRMDTKDYFIDVPSNYDPYHRIKELKAKGYDESNFLIEKKAHFNRHHGASKREAVFFEPETAQSIRRDASMKKFVKASTQPFQTGSSSHHSDIKHQTQQQHLLNQQHHHQQQERQQQEQQLQQQSQQSIPNALELQHQQQSEPKPQVKQEEPASKPKSDSAEPSIVLNLYPNHPELQRKYSAYVLRKFGYPHDESVYQQLDEDDLTEFERLYQMFQVGSKHVVPNTKAEDKKEAEKANPFHSERSIKRWVPEEMFCKRMGVPNPYSKEEMNAIERLNQRTHQPNMAKDSNRDFLFMDKKVFTSGGFYKENSEIDNSNNQATFDPTALGLPLSFKSNSFDRNQKERLVQLENQERSQKEIVTKQDKRNAKYAEDEEDNVPQRIEDQNIFDLIFGNDD